jgi:hypothetical protein
MLDQLFYMSQAAGTAALLVTAVGILVLAALAAWNRVKAPRPPSSEQIAGEAETYIRRYGDAAVSRIGTEMHQERTVNGISCRYRYLREISGRLCSSHMSTGNSARPSHSPIEGG